MIAPDATTTTASPSSGSVVALREGEGGHGHGTAVAERVRVEWHRHSEALCQGKARDSLQRTPPLLGLLSTMLHILRDIVNSLYGTRVDGTMVPASDIKVYLSELVVATTIGLFNTGGRDAVPRSKCTETRARYVMEHLVENAHAMLKAKSDDDAPIDPHLVLTMACDRHVFRPTGQSRSPRGAGRARRGAGVVFSSRGSLALVAAIDLAIEGVERTTVR